MATVLAAGVGGLVVFVAVIAAAAAGCHRHRPGRYHCEQRPTGRRQRQHRPGKRPLRPGLVPAYLIALLTGAADSSD
jgi:hypothetical protein